MSSPVHLSSPASASSSSSHQPAPFAMSAHPSRAPSAASGVSGASVFDAKSNHLGAGSPPDAEPSPIQSPVYSDSGSHPHPHHLQTPQPQVPPGPPGPLGAGPYAHVAPQSYLPPVTSSPPPHAPPYVPPPQHAMAPDPIHSVQMGMPPPGPGMMGSGGPWQNGPWRGPQPAPQQYRQGMPNGQPPGPGLQHQLPPNPSEPYPGGPRMSGTPGPGPVPQGSLLQHAIMGNGPRPPSAHGEGRERRRRDRDDERGDRDRDAEDEVISTIFVVGFPDDMQVSAVPGLPAHSAQTQIQIHADDRPRSESSKTSSPLRPASKPQRSSSRPAPAVDENLPPLSSPNSPRSRQISRRRRQRRRRMGNLS
jgi:hypothetical protein